MRLLRYGPPGQERVAAEGPDGFVDVSDVLPRLDGPALAALGTADLGDLARRPVLDLDGARIAAPIERPGKVVCIGLNYADHARESGQQAPAEPILFMKDPGTVVGPYETVLVPPGATKVDWEVELGVVIGSTARYLPDHAAAMACVAGYCVSHDVSERAYQLERGGQWVKGKSCETFNPLGPWLVTPDDVPDPQDLSLTLDVNGERQQDGTTADMIFGVAELVRYISWFMVLAPGDLINTGTPAGVGLGQDPPRYLRAGDVVELSISGLGAQRQTLADAAVDR